MKKFYILFAGLLLLVVQLKAQAPNSLSYQGVARNSSGLVLPNQAIGLRFTVHQGSAGGSVVYQETQSTTTNLLGLFTASIGTGTIVSGNFATIAWGTNTEFLQVEMDPTGSTSYLNMGTTQFLSVPYAITSGSSTTAWNLTGNSSTNGTDYIGTVDANDLIFKAHNNEVMRVANANNNVGIGTNDPNAGAVLDVSSSSQGILIPRMATAPTSPALGMMYFNTSTGCFMIYGGSNWQAMYCTCSAAPATPGTINGTATVCSHASGVTYSIPAISGATHYTWDVPTGDTIVAGQGTNAITVTYVALISGSVPGSISVNANNSCGTSSSSSFTVTENANVAITGQPSTPATICSMGTANFTVTATGSSLTYQWQEFVSSWHNISNGGVYSGATMATLSILNPPVSMNGYQYRCIVNGDCPPGVTSNAATMSVQLKSVPITITNSQGTATSANFQQMITVNSSTYTSAESSGLQNIEFTTGAGGTGTALQAWIESGATNTSARTVYWVNLGSNVVPANGTLTIYMNFMPTNVLSATGPTGEAPQLSGTYAQYDNGSLVFPTTYTNFAGTSIPSGFSHPQGTGYTINNGYTSGNPSNILASTSSFNILTNTLETYGTDNYALTTDGNDRFLTFCVAPTGGAAIYVDGGYYEHNYNGSLDITTLIVSNPVVSSPATNNIWSLWSNAGKGMGAYNYTTTAGSTVDMPSGTNLYIQAEGRTGAFYQWMRIRTTPPGSVMPTAALGSTSCN